MRRIARHETFFCLHGEGGDHQPLLPGRVHHFDPPAEFTIRVSIPFGRVSVFKEHLFLL